VGIEKNQKNLEDELKGTKKMMNGLQNNMKEKMMVKNEEKMEVEEEIMEQTLNTKKKRDVFFSKLIVYY
jgi:hypothetical protein